MTKTHKYSQQDTKATVIEKQKPSRLNRNEMARLSEQGTETPPALQLKAGTERS